MVTQADVHALAKSKGWYDTQELVERKLLDAGATAGMIEHVRATWRMARLMLIVTEVAEAAEELRVGGDQRQELADVSLRLKDYAESVGVDLEAEESGKHLVNLTREHKHGGKVL